MVLLLRDGLGCVQRVLGLFTRFNVAFETVSVVPSHGKGYLRMAVVSTDPRLEKVLPAIRRLEDVSEVELLKDDQKSAPCTSSTPSISTPLSNTQSRRRGDDEHEVEHKQ